MKIHAEYGRVTREMFLNGFPFGTNSLMESKNSAEYRKSLKRLFQKNVGAGIRQRCILRITLTSDDSHSEERMEIGEKIFIKNLKAKKYKAAGVQERKKKPMAE